MAKQATWSHNITLSWTPSGTSSTAENITESYIVESCKYTGEKQDLVEINDIASSTMYKNYVLGMKEAGELEVTMVGNKMMTVGSKGTVTLSIGSGSGSAAILSGVNGVITDAGSVDISGGSLIKSTVRIKLLNSSSDVSDVA